MKIPDGWVLVPKIPTAEMIATGCDLPIWKTILSAAPPPPVDQEIATGMAAPGISGALYRLLDRCDYREVEGWVQGEILRQTPQSTVVGAMAAMIASCALQLAGRVTRPQMRQIARETMQWAVSLLEKDIEALVVSKKADTVLRNRIRAVDGG